MQLQDDQILDSCRELWKTTLGLGLMPNEESGSDGEQAAFASYVKVSGDFRGAIILECPAQIARHAAAMLFETDSETIPEDEMQDAVEELTRIVGKGIQKQFFDPGKVSAPKPLRHDDATSPVCAMEERCNLHLFSEGLPIRIAILESSQTTAAAASEPSASTQT
ncbi:MAG: chemotaxis protein CheX [Acidobacteriota bacterium]|nr:chemotaxis protein CheX [Acidobacteriota bacterium]MDH3786315.1 chemotaxis protein CheX [Acidobacteriota bacterium]